MDKEQVIKDIIYVSRNWNWESKREQAEDKLHALLELFPGCQQCGEVSGNVFLVIEEVQSGWLAKKFHSEVFSVCSLKCLFDRGLKPKAYYSLLVRLAGGDVCSVGFQGRNMSAINEFANQIV